MHTLVNKLVGFPMKPRVIIVGTGHHLQAGSKKHSIEKREKFRAYIDELCKSHRIKLVVEEMSEDVLPDYGVVDTIPKEVAKSRRDVKHEYINATEAELSGLSIDRRSLGNTKDSVNLTDAQFAVLVRLVGELRECLWLTRVLALNIWPTLLVCGASHVSRIEHLFNSVGKLAFVACHDYEP
jgi:hypothetical protein